MGSTPKDHTVGDCKRAIERSCSCGYILRVDVLDQSSPVVEIMVVTGTFAKRKRTVGCDVLSDLTVGNIVMVNTEILHDRARKHMHRRVRRCEFKTHSGTARA